MATGSSSVSQPQPLGGGGGGGVGRGKWFEGNLRLGWCGYHWKLRADGGMMDGSIEN